MIKNIAIVGYGHVGKMMESFFGQHHRCIAYDAFIEGRESTELIHGADVSIICVGTPPYHVGLMPGNNNYACDISSVDDVISWNTAPLIIIKSTVAVGTTDMLKAKHKKRIIYSPQFCDGHDSDYFVFGGDPSDTKKAVELFATVGGSSKKYIQTDARSAEMMKHVANAYQITKLNFCKQMSQACQNLDVDYNVVRELWLNDTRVNSCHTLASDHANSDMKKDFAAFVKQAGL